MATFDSLPVHPDIVRSLKDNHITELSPVQAATLPVSLENRDVMAQAQTGSGKTLAFAIPCIQAVDTSVYHPQAVILCPTRELAEQVAGQVRMAARYIPNLKVLTLCGGQPMGPQIQSLKHGSHIVVGTPGRVMDHVQRRRLDLSGIRCRVLDEADRMLDMGFEEDLSVIFSAVPENVQTLLMSATYTDEVASIAQTYLRQAEHIDVTTEQSHTPDIEQVAYETLPHTKMQTLKAVLTHHQPDSVIVFCNTRRQVAEVVDELITEGFSADGLQGDMEQQARTDVLMRFASDALNVLVATDVAARGLDIEDVACVVNFSVSEEPEAHVHRIGRTARAGKQGIAVTLLTPEDVIHWKKITERASSAIPEKGAQALRFHKNRIVQPEYDCIVLQAGKKQKLRPGDLVGALTKDADVPGEDIGNIAVQSSQSYIAVKLRSVKRAMRLFREGKIKGKRVRAKRLSN